MDDPVRKPGYLTAMVVRWISDEPQPGWVEAPIVDANGREWSFFDKPPIFDDGSFDITPSRDYPAEALLRVWLGAPRVRADGKRVVTVRTRDVDASDGRDEFEVDESDLR